LENRGREVTLLFASGNRVFESDVERLADFGLRRRDMLAIPAENNAIYGRPVDIVICFRVCVSFDRGIQERESGRASKSWPGYEAACPQSVSKNAAEAESRNRAVFISPATRYDK